MLCDARMYTTLKAQSLLLADYYYLGMHNYHILVRKKPVPFHRVNTLATFTGLYEQFET